MYEITAKAEADSLRQIHLAIGPMLKTLLGDRFALRFHYETRQLSVYALTVASNGSKLKLTAAGSCTVVHWPFPELPAHNDKPVCGIVRQGLTTRLNHTDDIVGMSIGGAPDNPASLAAFLSSQVGETVLDKTGLKGLYNIHLEWNLAATEAQLRNGKPRLKMKIAPRSSLLCKISSG